MGEKELDAIIASPAALQVPPTYRLESYVINTGNTISASAQMKLTKNGQTLSGVSLGDGRSTRHSWPSNDPRPPLRAG